MLISLAEASRILGTSKDTISVAVFYYKKNNNGLEPSWYVDGKINIEQIHRLRQEKNSLYVKLTNPKNGLYWKYKSFFDTEKDMSIDVASRSLFSDNVGSWLSFFKSSLWVTDANYSVIPRISNMALDFEKVAELFLSKKTAKEIDARWKEKY